MVFTDMDIGDGKNGKKGPKYLVAENTFGIKTTLNLLRCIVCHSLQESNYSVRDFLRDFL